MKNSETKAYKLGRAVGNFLGTLLLAAVCLVVGSLVIAATIKVLQGLIAWVIGV